mmetsp:Transcript_5786/g.24361  ORF Transcript_5786/g.24361 Transcript_5786/m.24361 type:complete len:83 (+) Transcript_5786:190-438(+)
MESVRSMSGAQRQELEEAVQAEMLNRTVSELIQTLTRKCFQKCVTRPSGSLTGAEQNCIAKCVDRYIESMNIVSKTLMEKQE